MRAPIAALVLASFLLAGCTAPGAPPGPDHFSTLVASFHNTGSSGKKVDLRVTGPGGGEILHEAFTARAGYTNFTMEARAQGTYTLLAKYDEVVDTSTGNTQRTMAVKESWRHTIESSDCQTETAIVRFTFSFRSGSSTSWDNSGSRGICVQP